MPFAHSFVTATGNWIPFAENLATANLPNIYGLTVPVICKNDLIEYKRLLGRDVDKADVAALTAQGAAP